MRAFNPSQLVRNNSDDIKLSECFFIFKKKKTKQNKMDLQQLQNGIGELKSLGVFKIL